MECFDDLEFYIDAGLEWHGSIQKKICCVFFSITDNFMMIFILKLDILFKVFRIMPHPLLRYCNNSCN